MSENEKKLDLQADLGMSRRDLLRRGAVVGGALLWVAPAIQSLTPPAYANTVSEQATTCCSCRKKNPSGLKCGQDHFTSAACDDFCGSHNNVLEYSEGKICGPKNTCVPIA
jgi:hypothetical protein